MSSNALRTIRRPLALAAAITLCAACADSAPVAPSNDRANSTPASAKPSRVEAERAIATLRREDAIRYHLNAVDGAAGYVTELLPPDLRGPAGPMQPVLERLDPRLREPVKLTDEEFASLVDFVRNGLLDPAARPHRLRRLIPEKLPSGQAGLLFQ